MPPAPGNPTPRQRLAYAFGARLPTNVDWVRHDLTDAGWRLRVLGRVCVQLSPFVVVALLVPGIDALARVLLVLLLVIASLMTVAMVADQLRDRRLRQHGLPVPEDPDEQYRNRRAY